MESTRLPLNSLPDASVFTRKNQAIHWILFAGLLTALAAVLFTKMDANAGGADSSGYMNAAKLLSQGRIHVPMREVANLETTPGTSARLSYAYVPLGFRPSHNGQITPTYPIGLPLLIAATATITGWEMSPGFTIALHSMAGLVLVYALGRKIGLSRPTALLGMAIIGTGPLYILYSLQLMSDMPALTWCTAAILCAWQSRSRTSFALAAGIAMGIAVLIRPSDVLLIFPIAVALGFNWRRWSLLITGGIPSAIALAMYNVSAYGDPLASGYGNISDLMSSHYVKDTLLNYVHWLPALLTPVVILALGFPLLLKRSPRIGWMLLAWWLSFATFYAFYYYTHETWWYLRFILPCFPALVLTALFVGSIMIDQLRTRAFFRKPAVLACLAGIVVMTVAISNAHWIDKQNVLRMQDDQKHYVQASAWARDNLPAGSVIACMQVSGALLYYTDFPVIRWDSLTRETAANIEKSLSAASRPLYAMTFPFEWEANADAHSLPQIMPGDWQKITQIGQTSIWKLMPAALSPAPISAP
jgi:hypothetical protein